MTATLAPAEAPEAPEAPEISRSSRWLGVARGLGRTLVAVAGAIVIFGVFMKIKGVDPITAYRDMWESTFSSADSIEQIFVKATPLIFAALAVTVPARAGLVNVGGEGQLVMGGIGATAVVMWFGHGMPTGCRPRPHGPRRRDRRRDLGRARGRAPTQVPDQRSGDDAPHELHRGRPDAVPRVRRVEGPGLVR